MSIPDYQSLMLPVLLASSKGEVRIGPIVDALADQLSLSPEDRSELLPSGQQTVFSNRVHWAKSYLSKAQLVEITRRGYFRITQRGQTVLQSSPKKIDNKFLMQFEEFRHFRERSSGLAREENGDTAAPALDDQRQTPDETMRLAYRQIETALIHDLLERIRNAPPDFFERLMVNLLISMGECGHGVVTSHIPTPIVVKWSLNVKPGKYASRAARRVGVGTGKLNYQGTEAPPCLVTSRQKLRFEPVLLDQAHALDHTDSRADQVVA